MEMILLVLIGFSFVLGAQLWNPFARAQPLQFRQREVFAEPSDQFYAVYLLGGLETCELGPVGDVGGVSNLVLVSNDQMTVFRGDHIRLDEVGTLPSPGQIRRSAVFQERFWDASVSDDERLGSERLGHATRIGLILLRHAPTGRI